MANSMLRSCVNVAGVTTCPICTELLETPKSLPCLHTFCLECIRGHCRDIQPGDERQCPVCRRAFRLPAGGPDALLHNFFLQNLVDARKVSSGQGVPPCDACAADLEDEIGQDVGDTVVPPPATRYCVTCMQKLCERCSRPHRRMSGSPHNVVAIGKDVETQLIQTRGRNCERHGQDEIKYHCIDCQMDICSTCFHEEHQSHRLEAVAVAAAEALKMIEDNMRDVICGVNAVRGHREKLERVKSQRLADTMNTFAVIRQMGEKAKQIILENFQQLISQVETFSEEINTEIDSRLASADERLAELESFGVYLCELTSKGRPCDITQTSSAVRDRAKQLLQTDVSLANYSPPYIRITPGNFEEVTGGEWNPIGRVALVRQSGANEPAADQCARSGDTRQQHDDEIDESDLEIVDMGHEGGKIINKSVLEFETEKLGNEAVDVFHDGGKETVSESEIESEESPIAKTEKTQVGHLGHLLMDLLPERPAKKNYKGEDEQKLILLATDMENALKRELHDEYEITEFAVKDRQKEEMENAKVMQAQQVEESAEKEIDIAKKSTMEKDKSDATLIRKLEEPEEVHAVMRESPKRDLAANLKVAAGATKKPDLQYQPDIPIIRSRPSENLVRRSESLNKIMDADHERLTRKSRLTISHQRPRRRLSIGSLSTENSPHNRQQTIVIDGGSGVCKAGFAGNDKPEIIFSSVTGTSKFQQQLIRQPFTFARRMTYVGEEALARRGRLTLKYPINHGVVDDWEGMETIWRHVFDDLKAISGEHPVLLTEPSLCMKLQRERTAQIMFETFDVPGYCVETQAALSLYSAGLTTGVVLDCGDGLTQCVPVVDGVPLNHAVHRTHLAGRELTNYLVELLKESDVRFYSTAEYDIARQIKETLCYVAVDFEQEMASAKHSSTSERAYRLPDGGLIDVGSQRFRCPETLFKPSLIGTEDDGIHERLFKSIQKCESSDLRREMYANIVLTGGTTLLPGFVGRLDKEFGRLVPSAPKVSITALPDRKYSAWRGGSMLASMPDFSDRWISRNEYEEEGQRVVHRKCPNGSGHMQ